MASKKDRLSETERFIESGKQKKVSEIYYLEAAVRRCSLK